MCQVFVPPRRIPKTATHFHFLVREYEWCVHYLLCRLHRCFCHLLVVVAVAAVVVIFGIVVVVVAIVVVSIIMIVVLIVVIIYNFMI